ncbi:aspartate transaminase aat1 [Apiotrichum porosum]|uniref:Aspartate aminotransferase n=1 Tax=Apiotrichum porosum TaxID=105984 RepID=A0A427XR62_9TREE|nr:aspartate transaminase aat1 [Apiotrichum porosum]RSH81298.1 aspartate transaminase aat1 [Apiotrichum porosum]
MSITSFWSKVPQGPADPILGVTDAFKRDPSKSKINVGVGAYRDENGKPYVLDSVRKAEDIIHTQQFLSLASKLAYGADSKPLKENRVAVVQSISGTGALRIGMEFCSQFYPGNKTLYLPNPTWGAHPAIADKAGLEVKRYRYFKKETLGLDFDGMKEDLTTAPEGSIILLHACAQNPTGIDLTQAQWRELSDLVKSKRHLAFFDMAYQGFASGDVDRDAFALRYFVEQGHEIMLCQSFAKNLGLYGERAGTFSMVTASPEEKERVLSQLKRVIRPLYSSPPLHPAQLVATILGSPALYTEWLGEVKKMADRIIAMRARLYDILLELQTPGNWDHIKSQIGMFSFTGLTPEQVAALAEYAHIYMTTDGRISMAGLNEHNIRYFAESMSKAIKGDLAAVPQASM